MGLHSLQTLRHFFQCIVHTGDIAVYIIAQFHKMGHLAFQGHRGPFKKSGRGNGHCKTAVTANLLRLPRFQLLAGRKQGFPGLRPVSEGHAADLHPGKALFDFHSRGGLQRIGGGLLSISGLGRRIFHGDDRVRVCRQCFHIGFETGDKLLVLLDLLREVFQKIVLQPVLLALMVGFQQTQAGNVNVQVHALFDAGVPGTQGLDFCIAERRFVHILAGAHRGFRSHDL